MKDVGSVPAPNGCRLRVVATRDGVRVVVEMIVTRSVVLAGDAFGWGGMSSGWGSVLSQLESWRPLAEVFAPNQPSLWALLTGAMPQLPRDDAVGRLARLLDVAWREHVELARITVDAEAVEPNGGLPAPPPPRLENRPLPTTFR